MSSRCVSIASDDLAGIIYSVRKGIDRCSRIINSCKAAAGEYEAVDLKIGRLVISDNLSGGIYPVGVGVKEAAVGAWNWNR
jgi:hypothetical protein